MKTTTTRKDYHMNPTQLNNFSAICTMGTLKRLLATDSSEGGNAQFNYIDDLRRTWTQCDKADKFQAMTQQTHSITTYCDELEMELEELHDTLLDFTLSAEERALAEERYFIVQAQYIELCDIAKDLKAMKSTSYSDLKDLMQEFIVAYMTAMPTYDDYIAVIGKVSGMQCNGRTRRKQLRHIIRIKYGMRAINRYIRKQASCSADYSKKTTSLEVVLENGEKIKAITRNTYADDLGDLARIRNMALRANLSAQQSRFIEHFCSKEARAVEQQARTEYHAKMYDKMILRGERALFDERISKIGYDARKEYAFECIGINTPQAKSNMMKRITEKLAVERDTYIADMA